LTEAPAPARRPEDVTFSWALGMVALLPRLFVAIAWAKEPVWDGHYYHLGASRLAAGLGYSEDVLIRGVTVWKPWAHYPVGYSGLLSLFYRVFGDHLLVAPLLNALLGAATALLVHRIALHQLGTVRARVAGGIAALHPGLIAYCPLVMTEIPTAFLLVLLVWVLLHYRGRWHAPIGAGLILGILTLMRPASLLLVPLVALCELRPWRLTALKTAATLGIALVVVMPWTIRNCVRMDGCALVSTNGGWNLAIGALTETGRFKTLRAKDGCPVVTGQVQQDDCWAEVAWKKIKDSPGRWLALAPKKLAQTFNHESFAIEYMREADPGAWPEKRRQAARGLLTLVHLGLLGAAALSIVAPSLGRLKREEQYWQIGLLVLLSGLIFYGIADQEHPFHWLVMLAPVLAFAPLPGRPYLGAPMRMAMAALLITAITHVIFFGEDRYHLFVSPLVCLLAAAALRSSERAARQLGTTHG
jgi:hypothetical protein